MVFINPSLLILQNVAKTKIQSRIVVSSNGNSLSYSFRVIPFNWPSYLRMHRVGCNSDWHFSVGRDVPVGPSTLRHGSFLLCNKSFKVFWQPFFEVGIMLSMLLLCDSIVQLTALDISWLDDLKMFWRLIKFWCIYNSN